MRFKVIIDSCINISHNHYSFLFLFQLFFILFLSFVVLIEHFLWLYSLVFSDFLDLWFGVWHHFKEILSHCCFFCSFLSSFFFFWDSYYTYVTHFVVVLRYPALFFFPQYFFSLISPFEAFFISFIVFFYI